MAEKQYLSYKGLQDVAGHVNTRLKTVTTIPASADNGAVRLYVGETSTTYTKGHIYQYNATNLEWVDITGSSADSYNVVEGYFNSTDNLFYEESAYTTPIIGASSVIYISLDTDLLYRYNGSIFIRIDEITIDNALSDTSENPVQNKIINDALSDKADKVISATNGDLAGLDANGNLADSGVLASDVLVKSSTAGLVKNDGTIDTNSYATTTQLADKTDKVANATNGNLAGLDSNGNLTDSGVVANNVIEKVATATGLLRDDGTVDNSNYATTTQLANKADKVVNATVNDFATLDSNGNLTDSGINKDIVPNTATSSNKLATTSDLPTELNDLSDDVTVTSPTNGQILKYNSTSGKWENQTEQPPVSGATFKGSILFANIPTTGMANGDWYDIKDAFTTDSRFEEGAGIECTAGTDIIWVADDNKWNILTPSGVNSFNGRVGAVVPANGDYDASDIDYDNTTSGLTATDVQDAIDELESNKADNNDIPTAYTNNPEMNGTASAGTSSSWAKGDHVHPTDTSRASANDLTNHINNTSNPHNVTASQIGLGSVVNTGDSATPVSGGTTKFTTGGAYIELNKKANKVSSPTNGNFAGLDSNGNLTDSGKKASDFLPSNTLIYDDLAYHVDADFIADVVNNDYIPIYSTTLSTHGEKQITIGNLKQNIVTPVVSGKADKVSNATSGNFAGLDVNGNLTDSGKKASDFLPSNTPIPDAVTANPQGTATGTLTKLGIGSNIYNIDGYDDLAYHKDADIVTDLGNNDLIPIYSTIQSTSGEKQITVENLKQNIVTPLVSGKANTTLIAPIQTTLTASKAYAVGEQFVYNQVLYKVKQAIASGATITIGTNAVVAGSVTEQLLYYVDVPVAGQAITSYSNDLQIYYGSKDIDGLPANAYGVGWCWAKNRYWDAVNIVLVNDDNAPYITLGFFHPSSYTIRNNANLVIRVFYKIMN